MDSSDSQEDLVVCSKYEGYRAYTSNEAHNHSGLSVEKHSNNFIVSNDVLVLEVCKRCTDVVIVKILPGYLHGSYRSSTRALVARIDHNVEEFDCRYCNSQDQYKIRPDDFSPDKLTRSHRCSGFCLPSSAHSLKNENKLSMEISCQLF